MILSKFENFNASHNFSKMVIESCELQLQRAEFRCHKKLAILDECNAQKANEHFANLANQTEAAALKDSLSNKNICHLQGIIWLKLAIAI